MKFLAGVMAILAVLFFLPVFMNMQGSHEIRGSTTAQTKKSAMQVRRNLPEAERNIFDTAFGILEKLKSEEGPDAFAKAVSGLDPDQVVQLAKQEVNQKIAAGHPDFKKYSSWDDMMIKLSAEGDKKSSAHSAPLRQSERPGRPN